MQEQKGLKSVQNNQDTKNEFLQNIDNSKIKTFSELIKNNEQELAKEDENKNDFIQKFKDDSPMENEKKIEELKNWLFVEEDEAKNVNSKDEKEKMNDVDSKDENAEEDEEWLQSIDKLLTVNKNKFYDEEIVNENGEIINKRDNKFNNLNEEEKDKKLADDFVKKLNLQEQIEIKKLENQNNSDVQKKTTKNMLTEDEVIKKDEFDDLDFLINQTGEEREEKEEKVKPAKKQNSLTNKILNKIKSMKKDGKSLFSGYSKKYMIFLLSLIGFVVIGFIIMLILIL